jgi:hypothetical protein
VIKDRVKVLGEQHPDTQLATESLASMHRNREKRMTRGKQYPNAAVMQPQCVQPVRKIVAPELQHAVDDMLAQYKLQSGDRFLVCIIGEIVVYSSHGNSD